ncbi:MAG TPA: hypothetical protein VMZ03_13615 [Chitinophagaceae bacterium]|nr:hypothetical protein [Chitinophagaceae bacterium]
MSLNNMDLPATVIADLYQNTLIETGNTVSKQPADTTGATKKEPGLRTTTGSSWSSLGENQKNILIIVKNTETVYLPDNELTFLTGIIGACKLSLADVAVVNLHTYPDASYKELTHFFKSKIVLLFDTEPAAFGLPINFPFYQLQAFAGNTFLYAPSLKELENDKIEKSKLWVSLKRLFNL